MMLTYANVGETQELQDTKDERSRWETAANLEVCGVSYATLAARFIQDAELLGY